MAELSRLRAALRQAQEQERAARDWAVGVQEDATRRVGGWPHCSVLGGAISVGLTKHLLLPPLPPPPPPSNEIVSCA